MRETRANEGSKYLGKDELHPRFRNELQVETVVSLLLLQTVAFTIGIPQGVRPTRYTAASSLLHMPQS